MALAYVIALAAVVLVWLCVRFPGWVCRAAAMLRDGLVAAGRWYAPMEPPVAPPHARAAFLRSASAAADHGDGDHGADLRATAETEIVRRLLAGTISRTDYHRAMMVLSLEDHMLHRTPMPPASDR